MKYGADLGNGGHKGKTPGASIRLTHGGERKAHWMTLAEAQHLLGRLQWCVQRRVAEEIAAREGRTPPEPPLASAAALPEAA